MKKVLLLMAMVVIAFGVDVESVVSGIGIDTTGMIVSGFFIFAPYLLPPVMAAKINAIKKVALFIVNIMDKAEKTKAGLSFKVEGKTR